MISMDWNTILGSGITAGIISAWVSKAIAERNIYVENITKERAKWRERIRIIAQEYPIASEDHKIKLEIEIASRLNPYDPEDLKLFEALTNASKNNREELSVRVALLLKHDWERAKNEAKSFIARRINPVRRLSFEQYMASLQHYKNGNNERFSKEIERLTKDEPCM